MHMLSLTITGVTNGECDGLKCDLASRPQRTIFTGASYVTVLRQIHMLETREHFPDCV